MAVHVNTVVIEIRTHQYWTNNKQMLFDPLPFNFFIITDCKEAV